MYSVLHLQVFTIDVTIVSHILFKVNVGSWRYEIPYSKRDMPFLFNKYYGFYSNDRTKRAINIDYATKPRWRHLAGLMGLFLSSIEQAFQF